jgi:hypothetical protein
MSFDKILLEAIDEGFSFLGESPKPAIYFYLEKTCNIKRQDIPYKIEEFTEAIEKMFGAGAKIVEIKIMKILFKKVGCDLNHYWQQTDLEFTEYISAIKFAKKIAFQQRQSNQTEMRKRIVMFPQIP